MLIKERVQFEGDPAVVWERLSDFQRIPEFWHGTRSLRITGKEPSGAGKETVVGKARFAFGGTGDVKMTADGSTMTLTSDYTSGPFKGVQVVRIVGNAIEADWEVNFTGVFKLTSGWTGGHFRSGTLHALQRLCATEAPGTAVAQP